MTKASIRIRRATPADVDTVIAFNSAMAEETENKKLDPKTLSAGVRQALTDENRCVYFVGVYCSISPLVHREPFREATVRDRTIPSVSPLRYGGDSWNGVSGSHRPL